MNFEKAEVTVLDYTPLIVLEEFIENYHPDYAEHIKFTFYVKGISRSCLQELVRHQHLVGLSVKSSRYTLKELKGEKPFGRWVFEGKRGCVFEVASDGYKRASKYLVWTGNSKVDWKSVRALEELRDSIADGISNDVAKYSMPEAYKTELTWTINMRSLRNFLSLRSDKAALWEIRALAHEIYKAVPEEYKFLVTNQMKTLPED